MAWVFVVVLGFTLIAAVWDGASEEDAIGMLCPAIEGEDGGFRPPVSLVVLGSVKMLEKPVRGDGVFEINVKRVICGSEELETVRFG